MWLKSCFTIPAVAAISFCLIGGTVPAVADILHVPGDFLTIQEAIDAAMDGDEVEVHPGTYKETINFLGKAIRVYSSDGRDVTIIDAQGAGSVVTCESDEGLDTVLEGFTITGGNASLGGGMYNISSSPTVTDCIFIGNTATSDGEAGSGGGMYNNNNSNPTLTNCSFTDNQAIDYGGGMINDASSPILIDCIFSGNSVFIDGGGMYNRNSSPGLNRCVLTGNGAHCNGGGMYNRNSSPELTNCQFTNNITSDNSGGGMYNWNSSPTVTNCTFSGNSAKGGGGGMHNFGSSPRVTNCILWNDRPNEFGGSGTPIVTYSTVQGGFAGIGNIDADPLFVDPENDDYHLSPGSPSIDAGNNWGVPIDENDYDEDGVLCELFPVDLDGNPRFNADEADFDPGCGVPVVVDMGAYEYQFDPADQVTFADLNGDDAVGVADLLGLLVSWGPCGTGCCLADLDIDGNVGLSDLLALLANWGPCP